jgi:hypothetical protein
MNELRRILTDFWGGDKDTDRSVIIKIDQLAVLLSLDRGAGSPASVTHLVIRVTVMIVLVTQYGNLFSQEVVCLARPPRRLKIVANY